MPISSEPTSNFLMSIASNQCVAESSFFTVKFSHSSAFESQSNTSDGDWLPHYIKLSNKQLLLVLIWWFSHHVVSSTCDPMDCSPSFFIHGIFLGKDTGVGCYCFHHGGRPDSDWNCLLRCRQIFTSWTTRVASYLTGLHLFPNNKVLE